MKKMFLIRGFAFLLLAVSLAAQVKYPEPSGFVNDFAGILSPQARSDMELKLRDYQRATSIEIAVATVPSLEGIDIDEYALKLFEKWGVGDKDKNNGILVLVAPNEREIKIEVGYGMEPDLTDGGAGDIIRNVFIPYFRNGQMAEGIVAGVSAIITHLKDTPFEARAEERRIAEQKRQAQIQQDREATKATFLFMGIILTALSVIVIPILLIVRRSRRRRKLQAQFEQNNQILIECRDVLKNSHGKVPEARKAFEILKKETPASVWSRFEKTLIDYGEGVRLLNNEIAALLKVNDEVGWSVADRTYEDVKKVKSFVDELVGVFTAIPAIYEKFKEANKNSPTYYRETVAEIENARKAIQGKDVSDKAREYLGQAETKLVEAKALLQSSSMIDWLMVVGLYQASKSLASEAIARVKLDQSRAEEARRPKPSPHSSPRRTGGSSGFGGGGRSGGGFSGFGGGRSGGGGARGKW